MRSFARLELLVNRFIDLTRWLSTKQRGLKNGLWGVLDYIAQPILILLATPLLLQRIGPAQYGLWMLASALVSSGGLVSSGFGDAAIRYVSAYRGNEDQQGVIRIIRGMLTINLILSACVALALWTCTPYVVHHILKMEPGLQQASIISFRIGSAILVIKSIESIYVSTLRAFENYSSAVRIAIVTRISVVIGAVVVVTAGGHIIGIMLVTMGVSITGLLMQISAVRSLLGCTIWSPSLHRGTLSMITGFGFFSWLQCLAGISFSQADRLIIGAMLGVPALGYYSICTQIAQPIHGLLASGLQVFFPYLSARWKATSVTDVQHAVKIVFWLNLVSAFLLSLPLILGGKYALTVWLGADFAQRAWPILPITVCSYVFLGINVTAYYVLLAAGKIRSITYLNLAAGGLMLLAMSVLIPRHGIVGAAASRLIYGPITWLMYISVYKIFWRSSGKVPASVEGLVTEGTGA